MNLENTFITATRALNRNKMRSILTSIGIIIGVSSVIIMIGIGNSAKIAVRQRITSYGSNGISVYRSAKPLTQRDTENLSRLFPQIKYITPIINESHIFIKYVNKNKESRLFGVNNDYFYLRGYKIQYGRFFSSLDISSNSKAVVIGDNVRIALFGYIDPVGRVILIKNVPFTIIGTLAESGESFSGRDFDNLAVIPFTTAEVKITGSKQYDEINVSTQTPEMIDIMKNNLTEYFRRVHSIPPGSIDDFKIETSKEKLKMADDISNYLSILLAFIASISLIVGGIGIMNIMLVSVSERTREIGIRMAIGAKKRDILTQFLIESVTLSSAGGIIGIIFGLSTYFIIVSIVEWPFLFSGGSIFISFFFAFLVGIFFGYYPAKKAANLRPIEALRYE